MAVRRALGDEQKTEKESKNMRSKEDALNFFSYIPPTEATEPKFNSVTEIFVGAVDRLWDLVPDGPGKTYAFRQLAAARMAFNSAIAHEGE